MHEGGYNLTRDTPTRALVFTRPDGRVVEHPRIVGGPQDGRLDLATDTTCNDRRDGRTRVQYHDIMRYFAGFDSRVPKGPPKRPPEPEAEDPPGI